MIIQDIQEQHQILDELEQLAKLLPEPSQFNFLVDVSTLARARTIHIGLPFNQENYAEYRRAMGEGWQAGEWLDTQHSDGLSRHISFNREGFDVNVMIALHPNLVGSTCQLVQTGVREVPQFEVICS